MLGGCMSAAEINDDVVKSQTQVDKALKTIEPKPYKRQGLVVDERPWYGATAVPINNGQALPPILNQPDGVVMTFERPMTFVEVSRMIQAATGIRVTTRTRTATEASGGDATERTFIPADGAEVTGGRVVWQGPLSALLDQISDYFDAEWTYDGTSLIMSEEVMKSFMLHALAGSINFSGSIASASEEGSSGLPQVDTGSESTLELWGEIQTAVDSMVGDTGRATYSPSTGGITVTGSPSIVARVEEYLRIQNSQRLRRVAVAVKVLSIETSDRNQLGFNLSAVFERAFNGKPFQFSSVGEGLTAGILRAVPLLDPITGLPSLEEDASAPDQDTVAATLEASEEINRVSLTNSGAIVTLSDIPAPLQIGRTVAYLERVSATAGEGDEAGTVTMEPGEVSLGLTMNVLPRVIQRDRVLLRLAIGITDAAQPFPRFEAGGVRIELPEVETTGFLQNAVLAPGETLVLAGFEKNQNSVNDEGVPGGLWTGGTRDMLKSREATILLITSEILPEEPMTVIGGDS